MSDEEASPQPAAGKVKLPGYLRKAEGEASNHKAPKPAWMLKLSTHKPTATTEKTEIPTTSDHSSESKSEEEFLEEEHEDGEANEEISEKKEDARAVFQRKESINAPNNGSIEKPGWMQKLAASRHERKDHNETNPKVEKGGTTTDEDDASSISEQSFEEEEISEDGKADDIVDDNIKVDDPILSPGSQASRTSQGRLSQDLQRLRQLRNQAGEHGVETKALLISLNTPQEDDEENNDDKIPSDDNGQGKVLTTAVDVEGDLKVTSTPAFPSENQHGEKSETEETTSKQDENYVNNVPNSPRSDSSFAPPRPTTDREMKQDPLAKPEPVPDYKPVSPDTFAPPPRNNAQSSTINSRTLKGERKKLPAPPSERKMHQKEDLPSPPSLRNIPTATETIDENDDWMVPHRQDDDSSWVNPSHIVPSKQKQHLAEELKKKSVDLFPEDGMSTRETKKLKAINEGAKSIDMEYDARVGLIVPARHHDGTSVSETSFSEASKTDATTKVLESAVPNKSMDVWALPTQKETLRSSEALRRSGDGKDYRYTYIAQQHTHSTSSYADVVRERYFPKENNDYWAAPAKESKPELQIRISRDGSVVNGPADENEDWMPPPVDPQESATVDRSKYYVPSIADEKYMETRSVVTESSDWMGQGAVSRVDFTGNVTDKESDDNDFEWNPAREALHNSSSESSESSESSGESIEMQAEPPGRKPTLTEPQQNLPRPPSPQPANSRSARVAPAPKSPDTKYDYSPSGRLKFDMTPKTIMIDGDEDRKPSKNNSNSARRRMAAVIALCFFLVLIPAAIALVVIFVIDPNNKRGNDGPAPVPTPTMSPVFPPSFPPNPAPTIDENTLITFLSSISADGGAALSDQSSPQYAAMQWLRTEANQEILDDEDRLVQRYSLATLFYATDGDQWTSNSGWLSSLSECNWFTTSSQTSICNQNTEVVALNLSGNNLSGTIPEELNLLSNSLVSLQLSSNKLVGQLPSVISDLGNLEILQLSQNQLRGTLPTTLGRLTNLRTLFLYFNSFTSTVPSQIGSLSQLIEIDLGGNQLTGRLPPQIGRLSSLESMSLYVNQFTGTIPSEISNLLNLKVLYLDSNSFSPFLPNDICNLEFDEFWTDCNEIGGCPCCTQCCVDGVSCG